MAGTKGRSGRPPKSLKILELEGNRRPDRHGDGASDVTAEGAPVKPQLNDRASRCWDRLVPDMVQMGLAK